MDTCATCGRDTADLFSLTRDGMTKKFDSFECAAHLMAPQCAHCQCTILGHPTMHEGAAFCCAHCAGIGNG